MRKKLNIFNLFQFLSYLKMFIFRVLIVALTTTTTISLGSPVALSLTFGRSNEREEVTGFYFLFLCVLIFLTFTFLLVIQSDPGTPKYGLLLTGDRFSEVTYAIETIIGTSKWWSL